MGHIFNTRCFKRGGLWFLTIGRFNFSFSISRQLAPCFVQVPTVQSLPLEDAFDWGEFELRFTNPEEE